MTKRLVRNRDPAAQCIEEPYDAEYPTMGLRWVVILADGRRMPWGNNMAQAWRLAHKRLMSEAYPLSVVPPPAPPPPVSAHPSSLQQAARRLGLDPAESYRERTDQPT